MNNPETTTRWPWLPYVAPMAAFLLITQAEAWTTTSEGRADPFWYPLLYTAKVLVVAIVAWLSRSTWADLRRPEPVRARAVLVAVALGLLVDVVWVGSDGWYPTYGGSRAGFNPMSELGRGAGTAFLLVRLLGLVVLVPLIEELFWRSFLMRWVIDPEFEKVPVGRVTLKAAIATAVLFALVHPEWLPALLTGLAWAWLLWWSRSLGACFISHATANLGLAVYVLATGDWKYW